MSAKHTEHEFVLIPSGGQFQMMNNYLDPQITSSLELRLPTDIKAQIKECH